MQDFLHDYRKKLWDMVLDMRKAVGIVAEFNPFHNGHAALLRFARGAENRPVVAVMSGNFTQRGSAAVTDKRVRAKAALLGGADLVLELPLPYAAAPARRFARGGVEALAATGVVDTLCFGSECGDIALLRALAGAADDPAVNAAMRVRLGEGITFAKARELAVADALGPAAAAKMASPNNALGMEYLRAAAELGWKAAAVTMRRAGAGHDSGEPAGDFASASYLRQRAGDLAALRRFVPEAAAPVYAEALAAGLYPSAPEKLETVVLAHLRRLGMAELSALPDLSEGLENRLYAAIRESAALEELELALKTKRYTMARVRRLILAAFLGLTGEDARQPLPYLRVLGCNRTGRELLSGMKEACRLPVSHSLAQLRAMGGACGRFAALEELATDLFSLSLPKPRPCGYEYTASAVFLKE